MSARVRRHLRTWDSRSNSVGVRAIRYPYFINAPVNDNTIKFGDERCGCQACGWRRPAKKAPR